jgi:hypothetical protein
VHGKSRSFQRVVPSSFGPTEMMRKIAVEEYGQKACGLQHLHDIAITAREQRGLINGGRVTQITKRSPRSLHSVRIRLAACPKMVTPPSPKVASHLNIKAVVPLAPEKSKDDPKDGMKGKNQMQAKTSAQILPFSWRPGPKRPFRPHLLSAPSNAEEHNPPAGPPP